MNNCDYKGYSLFSDINDAVLKARNRATILANIAEDNMDKEKRISGKGAVLMLGYMSAIPLDERKEVAAKFAENMNQRGFAIVEKPVAIH